MTLAPLDDAICTAVPMSKRQLLRREYVSSDVRELSALTAPCGSYSGDSGPDV